MKNFIVAVVYDSAFIQGNKPFAIQLQKLGNVGNNDKCFCLENNSSSFLLLLEYFISNGQAFVKDKDVGIRVYCNGKTKTERHPA